MAEQMSIQFQEEQLKWLKKEEEELKLALELSRQLSEVKREIKSVVSGFRGLGLD